MMSTRGLRLKAQNGSMTSILQCPKCFAPMSEDRGRIKCTSDPLHTFPIVNGVVRFLNEDDPFYGDKYTRQVAHVPGTSPLKDWVFFHLVQSGVLGEIRKELQPGGRILDFGCAGGVRWLGKYGDAIGLDVSIGSLESAVNVYQLALQAPVENIPLSEQSIDVAYSSYVFEHLPADTKVKALEELQRVLRPGGSIILQFDTLSNNRLMRSAERDPDAYRRWFIDNDGHYGLEPLSIFFRRLDQTDFTVTRVFKFGTTFLQYTPMYARFESAYGTEARWARYLGKFLRAALRTKAGQLFDFMITAFYRGVNRFTDGEGATNVIVVAQKN